MAVEGFEEFEKEVKKISDNGALSNVVSEINEVRKEIALTSEVVGTLSSHIKKMGSDATSTAIALNQMGKTNKEALQTIDNQIDAIQKDFEKLNEKGLAAGESFQMAGNTEEETALISSMISLSEDYIKVLETLRESRAKALIATSANELMGGADTAQTEEQVEQYMQVSLAVGQYLQALESLATLKQHATSEEAQAALDEEANAYTRLVDSINAYRAATGQAELTAKEMSDVATTSSKKVASEVDAEGIAKGYEEISDSYSLYDRNLARDHGAKVRDKDAEQTVTLNQEVDEQAVSTEQKLDSLKETAEKTGEAIKKATQNGDKNYGIVDLSRDAQTVEELDAWIRRCIGDIAEMRESAQNGEVFSVTETAQQIQEAEKELKRLEQIRDAIYGKQKKANDQKIKSDKVDDSGKNAEEQLNNTKLDSEAYDEGVGKANALANSFELMKNAFHGCSEAITLVSSKIRAIGSAIGEAIGKVVSFAKSVGSMAFSAASAGLKALSGTISMVGNAAMTAGTAVGKFVTGGIMLLGRGAAAGAQGLAKLGSSGFNLVRAGAEKAGEAAKGLLNHYKKLGGDTAKKLTKSFTSIQSLLKRRIKRTFISGIFNQAKEGLQSLAKQSEAFNKAMSNIKNSAKTAAGNLAVTFGGLITTIEPILTRIINIISKVITYINALFAKLSGQSSVMVAKQATDDYAKSLNKAGGAADNAAGKFDELNVIGKESSGGADDIKYEQQEIASILPAEIQKMYDDLYEAINSKQWEEAGKIIGEFANSALTTLDESIVKLRGMATEYAQIGAEFANGLIRELDFHKIGEIIGDGINLIADTLNTILTTFDFDMLGKKLSDKMNGIFDTVDFTLVGQTAGNLINALWDTIDGYVSNLDWGNIGSRIAEAISSWGDTIDFKKVAHAITTGINGLGDLIYNLVYGLDLSETMGNFGEMITEAFTNINWTDIGVALGSGFSVVFEYLNIVLSNVDFGALGEGLANGLMGVIDAIDWQNLGETFATYYNGLFDVIYKFVSTIDFEAVAKKLTQALNGFIEKVEWSKIFNAITTAVNGLIPAFMELVTGVDWVGLTSDITTNLSNSIKNIDWAGIGTLLGTLLNTGFDVINTFLREFDFKGIGSRLGQGLQNLINTVDFEAIGEMVSGFINGAFSAISGFVNEIDFAEIGRKLDGFLRSINDHIEWDFIADTISTGISGLIDAFHEIVRSDTIVNLASNLGTTIGNILKKIDWGKLCGDISMGIKRLVDAFWEFITRLDLPSLALELANGINSFFDPKKGGADFEDTAKKATEGLNKVIEAFKNLVENIDFGTITAQLSAAIKTLIIDTDWDELVATVGKGVLRVTEEFFKLISNILVPEEGQESLGQKLANAINGIFKTADGEIDYELFKGLGQSLSDALKGIITNISTFFEEVDWEDIGTAIGEFITNIDWVGVAEQLLNLLLNALIAAAKLLGGLALKLVKAILGIDEDEQGEYLDGADEIAQKVAGKFSESFVGALEGINNTKEIKQALAGWLEIDYSDLANRMRNDYAQVIADALIDFDEDEVVQMLQTGEGYDTIANALAEKLGITYEEASYLLGDSGAAHRIAERFGMTYEEAVKYANFHPQALAVELGISMDEAYDLLGDRGYAEKLANVLGVSVDEAYKILSNEDVMSKIGDLFEDGSEKAHERFMDGLRHNNGSVEEVKAYYKQFGIDVTDEFAASFVDATPHVKSSSVAMLNACADAKTVEDLKNVFALYGETITNELAESLVGVGKDNIDMALYALGEGIDQTALSALDMMHFSENITAFMNENGATLNEAIAALLVASGQDLEKVCETLGVDAGKILGMKLPEGLTVGIAAGGVQVENAVKDFKEKGSLTEADKADIEGAASEAGRGSTDAFATATDEGVDDVEKATDNATSSITQRYEALPDEVKPYADQLMEYIVASLLEGNDTVRAAIESVAQAAVDRAKEILSGDVGVEIAKVFVGGIADGLYEMQEVLAEQSRGISNFFVSAFSESTSRVSSAQIGRDFIEGITDGMDSMFSSLLSPEAYSISREIIEAIKVYANRNNGYDIAYFVMQGLVDGLVKNKSSVSRIAYEIGIDLINSMERALGIASPSKAFKAIGDYSMQGLQVGMEGREKSVLNSVSDLASAITQEMSDTTDLGYTFDGVTSGLDAVVSSLSDVAMQFVYVANAINKMGGLEVPTIAEGKTIPYTTRIGADVGDMNGLLEGVTASIGNGTEEQVALLMEQNNLLRELLDKQFVVNVSPSVAWGRHNALSAQMYAKQTGG